MLRQVSLPSVRRQTVTPLLVVLVADGCMIPSETVAKFVSLLGKIEFILLKNQRVGGAAGAWNTALDFLAGKKFNGYVAILDDDDAWDENHLSANLIMATSAKANTVISGLRLVKDGVSRPRALPQDLTDRMFLTGNPGWQGSNTFVALPALAAVGGFRDGLPSLNDRDLAIRLLRWTGTRVAYTGQWTSTWHLSSKAPALSSQRSPAKLQGLRWFWHIYGSEMWPAETELFFSRATELFGLGRDEILSDKTDQPPHRLPRGDFKSEA
jgi:glycosyltransferase involved in cell wall biosynthesis